MTIECRMLFINFCIDCQEKKKRKVRKGLVVKPLRSGTIFDRAQIELINFQTLPDKDFKYILTYVNHFTKFCVLTPLTSKRAEEVANALLQTVNLIARASAVHVKNEVVCVIQDVTQDCYAPIMTNHDK